MRPRVILATVDFVHNDITSVFDGSPHGGLFYETTVDIVVWLIACQGGRCRKFTS